MKARTIRLAQILAVVLIAGLLLNTTLLVLSGIALRNAYRDLRQAGRPMTGAEIIPAEVPAGENAAPLYTSAFALLDAETIGEEKLFDRFAHAARVFSTDPESEEKRASFEQLLAREDVARAMDLIEQAVARPKCNFNLRYDQGAALLVPHVQGMLKMGGILAARAQQEARRQENDRAWHSVETHLRMADALREEPILISALVRIAIVKTALTSVRQVADLTPPSDETAARLMARLAAVDDPAPYMLAIDGERLFMGEWIFNMVHTQKKSDFWEEGDGPKWKLRLHDLLIGSRPARQADRAAYMRTMGKFTAQAARPYWEAPMVSDEEWERVIPWYGMVSRLILPPLGKSRTKMTELLAEVRVIRMGLALIRYKTAHGRYPAAPEELVPTFLETLPGDPFTGEALVYRPEGDGFILYSLGANRQDDGGTEESPENRDTKAFDIAWRRMQ